jgi:3-oxo-5alpha-steroid 4-dehydrogenase
MFCYLQQEVRGAVTDETLREFCESSPAMIAWLEQQGASFQGSLAPYKTSYPTDRHYVYYSGTEKAHPLEYGAVVGVRPAPATPHPFPAGPTPRSASARQG